MRFMMSVMMPAGLSPDEWQPSADEVTAMMRYNEELQKAGVVLGMDGLAHPSESARVAFAGGKPTVTDGPYAEAKEVVGGYWIIQARSQEEAVEWATRCPMEEGAAIEIRRITGPEDFSEEVQEVLAEQGVEGS